MTLIFYGCFFFFRERNGRLPRAALCTIRFFFLFSRKRFSLLIPFVDEPPVFFFLFSVSMMRSFFPERGLFLCVASTSSRRIFDLEKLSSPFKLFPPFDYSEFLSRLHFPRTTLLQTGLSTCPTFRFYTHFFDPTPLAASINAPVWCSTSDFDNSSFLS